MRHYHFISQVALRIFLMLFAVTGCANRYDVPKVEPELQIAESVTSGPLAVRQVVELISSYPWYAEPHESWIKMSRYRGQALKRDSIVFSCEENTSLEDREGHIEIRLMDQMSKKIKVRQSGRGIFITLPQNLVYFNNQPNEIVLDVLTRLDWEPETTSKDGMTFVRVDDGHIRVHAPANNTGKDREVEVKLVDKNRTAEATLRIIQMSVERILMIPWDKEKKDLLFGRGAASFDIPVSLNFDYDVEVSDPWIRLGELPVFEGKNVKNLNVPVAFEENKSGVERSGYLVIRNRGETVDASDTVFVSQKWADRIIYVKPGGTGDGTSWEQAFGEIGTAMSAASNNALEEMWIAEGEYPLSVTLNWKYVNVYGGFTGKETRFKERDLARKPVIKGPDKKNFMNSWTNKGDRCWMDGIIFADCDNYDNTGTGLFEIYQNHGFRNCEFRNLRHGKAILYLQESSLVNCIFHNLHSRNHLVRCNTCELFNVTIADSMSDGWNTNYFNAGTKLYNTLIWRIRRSAGAGYRAMVNGGTIDAFNCAIHSSIKEKNLNCTDCFELDLENSGANGPRFMDPEHAVYSLIGGSICLDKGNNAKVQTKTDFYGRPRISGGVVDVGAVEYQEK